MNFALIQPCYLLKFLPLFALLSVRISVIRAMAVSFFRDVSRVVLSFSFLSSAVFYLWKPIWRREELKVFSSLLPLDRFPRWDKPYFFPLTYIFTGITSILSPFHERDQRLLSIRPKRSLLDAAFWPEDLISPNIDIFTMCGFLWITLVACDCWYLQR